MVQMILKERGEKTLEMKRQEKIQGLNKSLRLSNPFGRVLLEINGLFNRSIN